jgi:hypothetical protein
LHTSPLTLPEATLCGRHHVQSYPAMGVGLESRDSQHPGLPSLPPVSLPPDVCTHHSPVPSQQPGPLTQVGPSIDCPSVCPQHLVEGVSLGYNTTVFAYGPSGTMQGPELLAAQLSYCLRQGLSVYSRLAGNSKSSAPQVLGLQ